MKVLITMILLMTVSSSYGFSTTQIFKCGNSHNEYDTVTVKSSLMPNGTRSFSGFSEVYGKLQKEACEDLHGTWGNYGSENCYVNEQVLFSHFDKLGTLTIKEDGKMFFVLCTSISNQDIM